MADRSTPSRQSSSLGHRPSVIGHQSSSPSHQPSFTNREGRIAMLIVPGQSGKDLCDPHLGLTRRDLLRVGGSGLMGISLGSMLELKAASAAAPDAAALVRRPGWGRAKSIIM